MSQNLRRGSRVRVVACSGFPALVGETGQVRRVVPAERGSFADLKGMGSLYETHFPGRRGTYPMYSGELARA
ncbi:hypothetical protein [Rhizobium phage RHph_X2_26]|nr:hypothetical protein [Rhizobium phage RHph_X2_26]